MSTADSEYSKDSPQWGPYILCSEAAGLKAGDIINMSATGSTKQSFTYRLLSEEDGRWSMEHLHNGLWLMGHSWLFGPNQIYYPQSNFRLWVRGEESPVASKGGCICKRCHSLNQYAAANQKDGSYVCFECR